MPYSSEQSRPSVLGNWSAQWLRIGWANWPKGHLNVYTIPSQIASPVTRKVYFLGWSSQEKAWEDQGSGASATSLFIAGKSVDRRERSAPLSCPSCYTLRQEFYSAAVRCEERLFITHAADDVYIGLPRNI